MRISGLASGMDVDSMVKQLMTAKREPLNKLNQQKQIMEWTRDSYREMNSKLVDFRNNKLDTYKKSSAMNAMKATVSGNTTALSAEGTADANQIPMNVTVNQLASNEKVTTTSVLTDITSKSTLKQVAAATGFTAQADPGNPSKFTYKMIVNGQTFSFDESKTISEVVNTINSNNDVKLTATFDQVKGQMILTSNQFDKHISVSAPGAAENGLLNVFNTSGGPSTTSLAQKANITVDGISKDFESNKFLLNGVSITLLGKTEDGKASKITTSVDSSKVLETITSFIKDYNELLNTLNTKTSEEKYRSYPPLTDDQKKGMTDDDIKNWQARAKSGILKDDSILTSAISKMRSAIQSGLNGIGGVDLASIGIGTGKYYEEGKIYIKDVDKLKSAIDNNPQGVMNLFQYSSTDTSKPSGIFVQISDGLNNVLSVMADKAGTLKTSSDLNATYKEESTMGKQLKDINKRISTLTTRLTDMETNYYKQFTAMETAMNKYNSQSASLSSFVAH
ncbi:flagellar filament capping protein FliD [Paenibacillus sp. P32E]|uniref:flagellar filament capping protein FliD n=1 Tax=Paenibacillus sp. P32E TaxID=1349434 RepID=UPI00093B2BA8|nr:flagellar filament capping protein FliD [Paenibacillus sp. P32E]OKP85564.1 hypothetical protein A3848_22700 [Paenibacillus sp. P32E]